MTQYLGNEIGIEYGSKKTWRVALVAPDGEILHSKGMGLSSSCAALSVAIHDIRKYLPTTTWCGKDLFLMSPWQMLGLEGLREWHCFRLAWGDGDPCAPYAESSNGRDLLWTLYFCANGCNQVVMSGLLPEEWWEWDDDERYQYIEQM